MVATDAWLRWDREPLAYRRDGSPRGLRTSFRPAGRSITLRRPSDNNNGPSGQPYSGRSAPGRAGAAWGGMVWRQHPDLTRLLPDGCRAAWQRATSEAFRRGIWRGDLAPVAVSALRKAAMAVADGLARCPTAYIVGVLRAEAAHLVKDRRRCVKLWARGVLSECQTLLSGVGHGSTDTESAVIAGVRSRAQAMAAILRATTN